MGVSLQVLSGPHAGKRFEFTQHDTFLVGRAADCHCPLPGDPFVSRRHFILEVNPPVCVLRDLLSRNGVRLNGRAIRWSREPARGSSEPATPVKYLKHGDELTVGKTVMKVVVEERAVCCHCGRDCEPREQTLGDWGPVGFACKRCRSLRATDRLAGRPNGSPEDDITTTASGGDRVEYPGYRVVRSLGGHDWSRVYLVRDARSGQKMALKVLRTDRSEGRNPEQARIRFLREMEICMSLRHPGIVHFVDQGRVESELYFVMEYCPAGSVADLMAEKDGRLPIPTAVSLLTQILDALDYAHGEGLVHRDVKPSNILLRSEAEGFRARLSDFGLAKNFRVAGLSGVTVTSYFSGSWPFMPREQVLAFKHLRPSSDIFSAGAALYNMITGQYVYEFTPGCDFVRVVLDRGVVPIRERNPEVPEALAAVIDRSVAPEPESRYPSAAAFKRALQEAME